MEDAVMTDDSEEEEAESDGRALMLGESSSLGDRSELMSISFSAVRV